MLFLLGITFTALACEDDPLGSNTGEDDLTHIAYAPQSYDLDYPEFFPALEQPSDNPMTQAGVQLGRHLFYDPILSADSTQSCASCHRIENAFSDPFATSIGIDGIAGTRSAMSLMNTGFFYNGLMWDGREPDLETQAIDPVINPVELHNTWENLEAKLRNHPSYPKMFREAFGIGSKSDITQVLVTKALAQFERIIVTGGNSKYDNVRFKGIDFFSDAEYNGFDMFFDISPDLPDAECGHCHNGPLLTSNAYFNNGLDESLTLEDFSDLGRGAINGITQDNGKFRATSLRNIALTAPYMHDGRFQTLEEVIDHYNSGGHYSPNVDPLIQPLNLTEEQKSDLLEFLHTLTDTTYLLNPDLTNPF